MKIYSMTATFGKLEHQTLTLKPGLNILEAPNEWGKSTWCAFLVNMLYGIDTRARNTKATIADKERYAPWSGAPMSGSIDLNWNGRDITIERSTRGRLIFGDFKAYETDTGIAVEELNSLNCGLMLLGVERAVFERAGFIRLTDLPVTQDDSLRRRLNNLVTTGDESGAGDKLAKQLKDLKNKCRFNRSGALPQAEAQQQQLIEQLRELQQLQQQTDATLARQTELEGWLAQLENHKDALAYADSQKDLQRIHDALAEKEAAEAEFQTLSQQCEALPPREKAQQTLLAGQKLQQQYLSLQMEGQMLPPQPIAPEVPSVFSGISPTDAVQQAKDDLLNISKLEDKQRSGKRKALIFGLLALVAALATIAGIFLLPPVLVGAIGGAITIGCGVGWFIAARSRKGAAKVMDAFSQKWQPWSGDRYLAEAEGYARQYQGYAVELARYEAVQQDHAGRMALLDQKIAQFAEGRSLEKAIAYWQQTIEAWDALGDARRNMLRIQGHAADLQAMCKTTQPPKYPDALTQSAAETEAQLANARFELQQLHHKLGQNQGRAAALGEEAAIRGQLKAVNLKIRQLEDIYAALELAQTALSKATTELQRRFAPRISKRAQELFGQFTDGRYQKLTLAEDLSLSTRTEEEDHLRPSGHRSDGTADQLYLALRLAVAEALTPDAPLVLDDALVRFDDKRLATAVNILRQMGDHKQVILFTCQHREAAVMEGTE